MRLSKESVVAKRRWLASVDQQQKTKGALLHRYFSLRNPQTGHVSYYQVVKVFRRTAIVELVKGVGYDTPYPPYGERTQLSIAEVQLKLRVRDFLEKVRENRETASSEKSSE